MPFKIRSLFDKAIDSLHHASQSLLFTCFGIAVGTQEQTPTAVGHTANGAYAALVLSNILQSVKQQPLMLEQGPDQTSQYPRTQRATRLAKSATEHLLSFGAGAAIFTTLDNGNVLDLTRRQDQAVITPLLIGYTFMALKHGMSAWLNAKTHPGHPSASFACYSTAGIIGSASAVGALSTLLTHDGTGTNTSGFMHQHYTNDGNTSEEYALLFFGAALAQVVMLLTRCLISSLSAETPETSPLSTPLAPTENDDMEQGHTARSTSPFSTR